MKLVNLTMAIGAALTLSACDEDLTESSFASASASGSFSENMSQTEKKVVQNSGNGYAFQGGFTDSSYKVIAGVIPGTEVGNTVASGTVQYFGTYNIGYASSVTKNGNVLAVRRKINQNGISLFADFGAGTLKGTDGALDINGNISGKTLSGNATYRGIGGVLGGLIGEDRAVGIVHGHSDDKAFAGGFVVTP